MKYLIYKIFLAVTAILFHANIYAQWTQLYNGTGNLDDRAICIAVDNNKFTYVAGNSVGMGTNNDYFTIKYDSNGVIKWSQRYNGPGNDNDYPADIEVDTSGNVYVTGYSFGNGSDYDYATIKYNSNGVSQWTQRYNGSGNSTDQATKLSVDNAGNVYVTGYSYANTINYEYVTIKYNSAGAPQWTKIYNGTGNFYDYANDIKTDESGNVYVTGHSYGAGTTEYDYLTIKYNTAGDELWTRRYDGTGNTYDQANKIVIDNSGNVYVTGYSLGNGTGNDFATIKYNSAGVFQWVQRYNGPANLDDFANDIETDNSGNVYVTGNSHGSTSNSDVLTIKYNTAGVVQWTQRYNGIANLFDKGNDLAIDNSGNVFVTGLSAVEATAVSGEDLTTIKYNAAGNPRGIIIYSGSGDGQDNGNAIAIDNSGNVYVAGFTNEVNENFITIKYLPGDFLPVNLQLTAFIEGFYNSVSNSQIGDTIVAELRFKFPPYNIVDSSIAFLSNSGAATMNFYSIPDNSYFISIKHRNSIMTWSSDTIPLSNSVTNFYDFTNAANKAFGNNMKQVDTSPVRYAIYSGDINQDGTVDLTDITGVYNDAKNFISGYAISDVTGDNFVDLIDLTIVFNNSNTFVRVIRP